MSAPPSSSPATSSASTPELAPEAPLHRAVILIVASAFFMHSLDTAVINTSLPQMARSFGVDTLHMSIGITVYLLTSAALIPASGWLADRYGARNIFMLALGLFTLASVACAGAQTLWQFCIARAVQGIGGALMTPVGRVVVLRNTEPKHLLAAMAWLTWPALTAPIIGPALGGFITTYLSWRWNFFINLPIGLVGMWLAWRLIPDNTERVNAPLDRAGLLWCSATLCVSLYALESIAHATLPWYLCMALLVSGVLMGYATVQHLQRASHPLLNLAAFAVPTFWFPSLSAGAWFRIASSALTFLLPLWLQLGFGLTPLEAGSWVLIYFVGNLGLKPFTAFILQCTGFRTTMLANGIITGAALIALGTFASLHPAWLLVTVLLIAGTSRSMQYTCFNTLSFADIPADIRSSAATLTSMLNMLGSLLGVATGAWLLTVSQWWRDAAQTQAIDFSHVYIMLGLLVLFTTPLFMQLLRDAGARVSGHQALNAAEQK